MEPLARRIFGDGDRPAGWFARKLRREAVSPDLSLLACEGDRLDRPLGYLLLGAPPSLPGVARSAGLGLVPAARGLGLGRHLLHAAGRRAADAGLGELHLLADLTSRPFYAAHGLHERAHLRTLHAAGRGPAAPRLPPPAPWDLPGARPLAGWLREAWERTEPELRATLEIHLAPSARLIAHLSREGRALLVQRLLLAGPLDAPVDLPSAAARLLAALPAAAPILLYGCLPDLAARLLPAGWSCVQEGFVMAAPAPLDTPRSPAPSSPLPCP